jgi:hypothetical protein
VCAITPGNGSQKMRYVIACRKMLMVSWSGRPLVEEMSAKDGFKVTEKLVARPKRMIA